MSPLLPDSRAEAVVSGALGEQKAWLVGEASGQVQKGQSLCHRGGVVCLFIASETVVGFTFVHAEDPSGDS